MDKRVIKRRFSVT